MRHRPEPLPEEQTSRCPPRSQMKTQQGKTNNHNAQLCPCGEEGNNWSRGLRHRCWGGRGPKELSRGHAKAAPPSAPRRQAEGEGPSQRHEGAGRARGGQSGAQEASRAPAAHRAPEAGAGVPWSNPQQGEGSPARGAPGLTTTTDAQRWASLSCIPPGAPARPIVLPIPLFLGAAFWLVQVHPPLLHAGLGSALSGLPQGQALHSL